jgi:hypothetical protein
MIEQPFFSPQITTIANQRAITTNNTMTGNNNANFITTVSSTNCPYGFYIINAL